MTAVRATAYRAAFAAAGAVALAAVEVSRPATLCLLRATTGVPCPLCGTTTALVHLGHGDVASALAVGPFVVVGLLLLVLAPVLAGRVRVPRGAAPWVVLVAAAWTWQLVRYDLL